MSADRLEWNRIRSAVRAALAAAVLLMGVMAPASARARETFAEHHAWSPRHIDELPEPVRTNVERQQRLCRVPPNATHSLARTALVEAITFVSVHYESLWCPNGAVCGADGCLHEIYARAGSGYRLVFRGYVAETRLVSSDRGLSLLIARPRANERELRWNGRSFGQSP